MVTPLAQQTLRLELRRGGVLRRLRPGGPWEVRIKHSDGRALARVPAGATVFGAGRVHEQMCADLRLLSEADFLARYRR